MDNTDARANRLRKELEKLNREKLDNITIEPGDGQTEDNHIIWKAKIVGVEGTPYFNGKFNLLIKIPQEYPFQPPKIKFDTKIFHPNISPDGQICLNILKNNWCASWTLQKIILAVMALLSKPNPDDPLVPEIAQLYISDRKEYESMAENYTKEYAI